MRGIGMSWVTVIAVVLIAGCSLPEQVRTDSRALALYVESVNQQSGEFKAQRDAIAVARTRNASLIEEGALRAEQRVRRSALEWEITQSKDRLALVEGVGKGVGQALQQRKELAESRQAVERAVNAATSAVSLRQDKLAQTSSSLAKLAEEKEAKEELEFYKGFFRQVMDNVKAAKERADGAAKSGQKAAEAKQGENVRE